MPNFIIECRSCGAQIECTEGMQTAVCRYCSSLNTVGIKAESAVNLYNRANYLRRTGEFDKAIGVYVNADVNLTHRGVRTFSWTA